jgi:hypothetical protein
MALGKCEQATPRREYVFFSGGSLGIRCERDIA